MYGVYNGVGRQICNLRLVPMIFDVDDSGLFADFRSQFSLGGHLACC